MTEQVIRWIFVSGEHRTRALTLRDWRAVDGQTFLRGRAKRRGLATYDDESKRVSLSFLTRSLGLIVAPWSQR